MVLQPDKQQKYSFFKESQNKSSSMEPEIGMYDYAPSITGIYEDGSIPEFSAEKLYLTVDDEEVISAM